MRNRKRLGKRGKEAVLLFLTLLLLAAGKDIACAESIQKAGAAADAEFYADLYAAADVDSDAEDNAGQLPAEEEGVTPESGIMQAAVDTAGYGEASEGGVPTGQLKAGDKVLLLGRTQDGWCKVVSGGQEMFVAGDKLTAVEGSEELLQELSELEKTRASEAEEDIRIRKEQARNRIWGIVIAVLIAGIFAAGIVAAIKSGGEGEETHADRQ